MQQVKGLSVQDLQQINGGASVCDWGVGLYGVDLYVGGSAGLIAGAVVGVAWIPVGFACS